MPRNEQERHSKKMRRTSQQYCLIKHQICLTLTPKTLKLTVSKFIQRSASVPRKFADDNRLGAFHRRKFRYYIEAISSRVTSN